MLYHEVLAYIKWLAVVWTRPQAISSKYMSNICDLLLVELTLLLIKPQIRFFCPLQNLLQREVMLLYTFLTLISHQLSPHIFMSSSISVVGLWNISGADTKSNDNLSNLNLLKGTLNVVNQVLSSGSLIW